MTAAGPAGPVGRPVRILAVSSTGGHWVQLMRLRAAWAGCEVTYVTTDPGVRPVLEEMCRKAGEPPPGLRIIAEANRWQKRRLLRQLLQLAAIMLSVRPDAVITTGAAPGYFALRLGRLIGARTVWIDSIANAEELSLSGQQAGRHADLWLTQWPHLAREDGPRYLGSVL
jgi:UDP-N-acetylglucosamine:LPS N-acetylglucosamine transferase